MTPHKFLRSRVRELLARSRVRNTGAHARTTSEGLRETSSRNLLEEPKLAR
jgi:hypothetical protein